MTFGEAPPTASPLRPIYTASSRRLSEVAHLLRTILTTNKYGNPDYIMGNQWLLHCKTLLDVRKTEWILHQGCRVCLYMGDTVTGQRIHILSLLWHSSGTRAVAKPIYNLTTGGGQTNMTTSLPAVAKPIWQLHCQQCQLWPNEYIWQPHWTYQVLWLSSHGPLPRGKVKVVSFRCEDSNRRPHWD